LHATVSRPDPFEHVDRGCALTCGLMILPDDNLHVLPDLLKDCTEIPRKFRFGGQRFRTKTLETYDLERAAGYLR
jgi:hypothetical protein